MSCDWRRSATWSSSSAADQSSSMRKPRSPLAVAVGEKVGDCGGGEEGS